MINAIYFETIYRVYNTKWHMQKIEEDGDLIIYRLLTECEKFNKEKIKNAAEKILQKVLEYVGLTEIPGMVVNFDAEFGGTPIIQIVFLKSEYENYPDLKHESDDETELDPETKERVKEIAEKIEKTIKYFESMLIDYIKKLQVKYLAKTKNITIEIKEEDYRVM